MIKNVKKIQRRIYIFLTILLVMTISLAYTTKFSAYANVLEYEEKIFCNVTIEDDFADDCLYVVLDKNISQINKLHKKSFFGNLDIKNIEDLSYMSGNIESNEYINKEEFRQILKLELNKPSKQNIIDAIHYLEQMEGILSAEPNYINSYKLNKLPNNSETGWYFNQWGLKGGYGIQAKDAWDYSTGSKDVKVAIIDSGMANHPDLDPNYTYGYDFVNKSTNVSDDTDGHGTNVAGIIGATGRNLRGMVGIAWDVSLNILQVTKENGKGDYDAILKAIAWSTSNEIDIINFSLGDYIENIGLKNAISNYKGLFVCAVGNEDSDNDKKTDYPSDYSYGQSFSDRVISVGAIMEDGKRPSVEDWKGLTECVEVDGNMVCQSPNAGGSNYGKKSVSLFAPGDDILTTDNNGFYTLESGTSLATPFVTGTAALLYSICLEEYPELTREQIAKKIKASIIDNVTLIPALTDYCEAGGTLNAYKAISNLADSETFRAVDNFGYHGSTYHWTGKLDVTVGNQNLLNRDGEIPVITGNTALSFTLGTKSVKNAISPISGYVTTKLSLKGSDNAVGVDGSTNTTDVGVNIQGYVSLRNTTFRIRTNGLPSASYVITVTAHMQRALWSGTDTKTFEFKVERPSSGSCISEGSLITLADGSQKPVEELTGNEQLLVWNLWTGSFDTAPILFIDRDKESVYEVINLGFSDDNSVKVISEHAFWDVDLNKYVFLRRDAAQYIGHWFKKQTTDADGNMTWTKVQLISVDIQNEVTTAWSPVTYGHLCYYVNGMLSMPGATEGLINIFDVNPDTMTIDMDAYLADIAEYGLLSYDDVAEIMSEEVFEAFGGQYLLVSIGKGLTTWDEIYSLLDRYADLF